MGDASRIRLLRDFDRDLDLDLDLDLDREREACFISLLVFPSKYGANAKPLLSTLRDLDLLFDGDLDFDVLSLKFARTFVGDISRNASASDFFFLSLLVSLSLFLLLVSFIIPFFSAWVINFL